MTRRKAGNGEGSVFLRTKRGKPVWVAQVSLGRDAKGKRKVTTRNAPTEAAARKVLREMLGAHDEGRLAQQQNATVATYALFWAREVKPLEIRASTAAGYEETLRRYVIPHLGNRRLHEVKAKDVQAWVVLLRKRGLSANTINQARRLLHGMYRHAERQGIVGNNPVRATDPVKRQATDKTQVCQPWTREETLKALATVGELEDLGCFLYLMLHTGMRPGEALGLRWADVSLETGQLVITGTLKEERRIDAAGNGVVRLTRNQPKTAASRRRLPISKELAEKLRQQRDSQAFWKVVGRAAEKWDPEDYILTTKVGTPFSATNLRKRYYAALAENGIRRIRMHDLRHVVAAVSLEADVPLEQVSQALGHTRLDTTKQIYAGHVQKLNDRFGASLAATLTPTAADQALQTVDDKGR
jgi:integrase